MARTRSTSTRIDAAKTGDEKALDRFIQQCDILRRLDHQPSQESQEREVEQRRSEALEVAEHLFMRMLESEVKGEYANASKMWRGVERIANELSVTIPPHQWKQCIDSKRDVDESELRGIADLQYATLRWIERYCDSSEELRAAAPAQRIKTRCQASYQALEALDQVPEDVLRKMAEYKEGGSQEQFQNLVQRSSSRIKARAAEEVKEPAPAARPAKRARSDEGPTRSQKEKDRRR